MITSLYSRLYNERILFLSSTLLTIAGWLLSIHTIDVKHIVRFTYLYHKRYTITLSFLSS
jgi:hypothetical protein